MIWITCRTCRGIGRVLGRFSIHQRRLMIAVGEPDDTDEHVFLCPRCFGRRRLRIG